MQGEKGSSCVIEETSERIEVLQKSIDFIVCITFIEWSRFLRSQIEVYVSSTQACLVLLPQVYNIEFTGIVSGV